MDGSCSYLRIGRGLAGSIGSSARSRLNTLNVTTSFTFRNERMLPLDICGLV